MSPDGENSWWTRPKSGCCSPPFPAAVVVDVGKSLCSRTVPGVHYTVHGYAYAIFDFAKFHYHLESLDLASSVSSDFVFPSSALIGLFENGLPYLAFWLVIITLLLLLLGLCVWNGKAFGELRPMWLTIACVRTRHAFTHSRCGAFRDAVDARLLRSSNGSTNRIGAAQKISLQFECAPRV